MGLSLTGATKQRTGIVRLSPQLVHGNAHIIDRRTVTLLDNLPPVGRLILNRERSFTAAMMIVAHRRQTAAFFVDVGADGSQCLRKGKKIRARGNFFPFVTALGVKFVNLAERVFEIYGSCCGWGLIAAIYAKAISHTADDKGFNIAGFQILANRPENT